MYSSIYKYAFLNFYCESKLAYNILTCKGWETATSIGLSFGGCMQAKLLGVILFFILAIIRKWGAEMMGISYSFLISEIAGMLAFVLVVTLTGNAGISLLIGLVVGILGGLIGGGFLPDGGGE